MSVTTTWNDAAVWFPVASTPSHDTVVSPIGNSEPDAGVQSRSAPDPRCPPTVTVYSTVAPPGPVAST